MINLCFQFADSRKKFLSNIGVWWSLVVEDDVSLCNQRCVRRWLLSQKAEPHTQLRAGHGIPAAGMGAQAVLCLWSCATARLLQWSSSKLVLAFLTRACQLDLSEAENSNFLV